MTQTDTLAPALDARTIPVPAAGALPLLGRIAIAAIFVLSGLSKIAQPGYTIGYIQSAGLPLPQIAFAVAVLVELGGGLALVAGFHTRIVAAVLAIFTLATAFAFHTHFTDQNQFIHFFKNVAIAGGLLQILASGGGRYALDARRRAG
jgi:putative oxidoreductase